MLIKRFFGYYFSGYRIKTAFFTIRTYDLNLRNHSFPIGDMHLVTRLMSKDLQAMSGFFFV
jgi:hypothetical protein